EGAHAVLAEPLLHGVGNRLHLALAGAAADQEVVGEVRDLLQLQDLEVDRLAVGGGGHRLTGSFQGVEGLGGDGLWIHRYRSYLERYRARSSGTARGGRGSPAASSSRRWVEETSTGGWRSKSARPVRASSATCGWSGMVSKSHPGRARTTSRAASGISRKR